MSNIKQPQSTDTYKADASKKWLEENYAAMPIKPLISPEEALCVEEKHPELARERGRRAGKFTFDDFDRCATFVGTN